MNIRLIVMDIDGTLLGSDGVIPAENIRAIKEAQRRGVIVGIASGRIAGNVLCLMERSGLRCPVISLNGGRVADENNVTLHQQFMEPSSAQAIFDVIDRHRTNYNIMGDGFLYTRRSEALTSQWELAFADELHRFNVQYVRNTGEGALYASRPVNKFVLFDTDELEDMRRELQPIPHITLTRSAASNIEIMPEGVDKATGLEVLARHFGIPMACTMALGDEGNDLPMLERAGWGVAMGNGSDAAKAAAKAVTDTNDRAGVAQAIDRYVLGKA